MYRVKFILHDKDFDRAEIRGRCDARQVWWYRIHGVQSTHKEEEIV